MHRGMPQIMEKYYGDIVHYIDPRLSYKCVCKDGFFGTGQTCDPLPPCCKTIRIDGSSKNFTTNTDGSSQIIQFDFICSYTHDQPPVYSIRQEYKAYICKGNPTNSFASWIDTGGTFGGYGFHMLTVDGRYRISSPPLEPGQEPPRYFFKIYDGFTEIDQRENNLFNILMKGAYFIVSPL